MIAIYRKWAGTGGIFSVIIIITSLLKYNFDILASAAWLNLAFLMLHQFEEYVFPGGFMDFYNNYLYKEKRIMKIRLNEMSSFHVNVTLGWTAYLICAIFGNSYPYFFMVIIGLSLLNGIVHTVAAIAFRMYNPGFITGLFIFIPFSLYITLLYLQNGIITSSDLPVITGSALLGTFTIPLTLFLFREKPESKH